MANIWSHLRGKKVENRFAYPPDFEGFGGSNLLGHWGAAPVYGNHENIDNDFISYVNGAYKSSGVVFAVCEARRLVFSEMRFTFQAFNKGRPTKLFGSKELKILEEPWDNGTTGDLLSRAIQDVDLCGNFYVVTEGVGTDTRLRRLRPDWVSIVLSAPPDKAIRSDIVGYVYKPGGTLEEDDWVVYPIDGSNGTVAHWAPIPDPEAQYRGMSWLTPIIREIMADKQATRHKLKFFENAATPNLAITMSDKVGPEQFKKFKQMMDETKGGVEHAYENLYLGGGANVEVIGANIQQMDFRNIQGLSETRIAAAGRVHPAIVGLSEGLAGSSMNEGNFRAAKDGFADGTLRPLWRSLCASLSVLIDEPEASRLWYDMRDIAFLRHDQKELAEIRGIDASTMAKLIMNGYTPESIITSIVNEDWTVLEHTGLYSVQLQPPLTKEEAAAANNKDPKNANGTDNSSNGGANGKAAPNDKAGKKPSGATDSSKPKKAESKSYEDVVDEMRRLDEPNYPEGVNDEDEQ